MNIGINDAKVREICRANGITDEVMMRTLAKLMEANNKALQKDIPNEVYKQINKGMR